MNQKVGRRKFVTMLGTFCVVILGDFAPSNSKIFTTRRVTMHWPAGKSFADLEHDFSLWLDLPRWRDHLAKLIAEGTLLSQRLYKFDDHAVMDFTFKSHQDLIQFESEINYICLVDERCRSSLGYVLDTEIVTAFSTTPDPSCLISHKASI